MCDVLAVIDRVCVEARTSSDTARTARELNLQGVALHLLGDTCRGTVGLFVSLTEVHSPLLTLVLNVTLSAMFVYIMFDLGLVTAHILLQTTPLGLRDALDKAVREVHALARRKRGAWRGCEPTNIGNRL